MDDLAKAAVRRVVAHVRDKHGSGTNLARAIEPWYGRTDRSTVDAWANGSNNPPAWVVFALAMAERISLDEFLLPAEDRRALQDQVAELRLDVQALQVQVAQLLEREETMREGERPA
jgi:hypothetical protein